MLNKYSAAFTAWTSPRLRVKATNSLTAAGDHNLIFSSLLPSLSRQLSPVYSNSDKLDSCLHGDNAAMFNMWPDHSLYGELHSSFTLL